MEQRKSARRRSSDGTSNRNMRSINNSREVSRRAKGKNRYAYEEDRRSARYYDDEEDYYRERPKKKSSSNDKKKRRPEEDYQNIRKMSDPENNKNRKNKRRRGRKKNRVSRTIGIILAIIQFILSVVLAVNVMLFNVLTSTYFLVLIGVSADPAWNYLADTDSGKRKRNWRKDILYTDLHHSGSGFFLYRKSK